MRALKFVIAGRVAAAALMSAAPAAAQYYPGYGYPGYGYGGGNVVGQVLNQVLGGGYGAYGGYGGYGGGNSQAAINQCTAAVQQRLSGGGYNGGYGGYGYNNGYAYGGGRVLGVSRVEPRSNGGLTVRGVATSGQYAGTYGGFGGGYGGQGQVDLTWKCKVDYRGFISDIDLDRAQGAYGNYSPYNNGYTPYNNGYDYSQYGYRRY
jgi:hypothetical protein